MISACGTRHIEEESPLCQTYLSSNKKCSFKRPLHHSGGFFSPLELLFNNWQKRYAIVVHKKKTNVKTSNQKIGKEQMAATSEKEEPTVT